VLLDLMMPHQDGVATARQLRQIRPDLPIILSSGYTEEEATRQFASGDLGGFLQKPYTIKELVAALRTALEPPAR